MSSLAWKHVWDTFRPTQREATDILPYGIFFKCWDHVVWVQNGHSVIKFTSKYWRKYSQTIPHNGITLNSSFPDAYFPLQIVWNSRKTVQNLREVYIFDFSATACGWDVTLGLPLWALVYSSHSANSAAMKFVADAKDWMMWLENSFIVKATGQRLKT